MRGRGDYYKVATTKKRKTTKHKDLYENANALGLASRNVMMLISVINQLDPIEELYNMYSEEENTPKIIEVVEDSLNFDLDLEDGLADPYFEL